MPYNVVQKIRNNYYLYEVTSSWDPETKKTKQSRKYIGKCDEEGNLMADTKMTVVSKNLGEYYLMHQMCISCGLWGALCNVYGEDTAKYLFAHSVSRALRSCPPTQSPYDIKASILPDYFNMPLDSKWITLEGYLNRLIGVYEKRQLLFNELADCDTSIVYELENLRNPVQFYKLYGPAGNEKFNHFPQKSLFLAVKKDNYLPFYFRMANYGGADRGSLKTITSELKEMGVKNITFFLGSKYYTENEISNLMSIDYNLVITLKDCPLSKQYIMNNTNTYSYNTIVYDDVAYKYLKLNVKFEFMDANVFIVLNGKVREESTLSFYRNLEIFEDTVRKMKWSKTLNRRLSENYGFEDIMQYFSLHEGKDEEIVIERNMTKIIQTEMGFGKTVVVSNSNLELGKIIGYMHKSDRFKQDLSIFRTDLQGGGALFPSNESAIASLMGDFFSMIMKMALINRVNASNIGDLNYLDVISEASTMKSYWVNGKYGVTEPSSSLRAMFEKMGMEPPHAGMRSKDKDLEDRFAKKAT